MTTINTTTEHTDTEPVKARAVTAGQPWRPTYIYLSRYREGGRLKVKLSLTDGGTAIELRESAARSLIDQIAQAFEARP